MDKIKKIGQISLILLMVITVAGCSIVLQKRHTSDVERIRELEEETRLLEGAKRILENKLKGEMKGKKVRVELGERGLVITFVAEVLFDSGKAKIKRGAYQPLDKIASVFNNELKDRNIGIEGHTDNEPIRYSRWKSNWELSTARATSVLHYLVDEKRVSPMRISATGYGEYRPIANNETARGKQKNRRVEVIVMPKKIERASLEELYEQKRERKYRK